MPTECNHPSGGRPGKRDGSDGSGGGDDGRRVGGGAGRAQDADRAGKVAGNQFVAEEAGTLERAGHARSAMPAVTKPKRR